MVTLTINSYSKHYITVNNISIIYITVFANKTKTTQADFTVMTTFGICYLAFGSTLSSCREDV